MLRHCELLMAVRSHVDSTVRDRWAIGETLYRQQAPTTKAPPTIISPPPPPCSSARLTWSSNTGCGASSAAALPAAPAPAAAPLSAASMRVTSSGAVSAGMGWPNASAREATPRCSTSAATRRSAYSRAASAGRSPRVLRMRAFSRSWGGRNVIHGINAEAEPHPFNAWFSMRQKV